VCANIPFYIFGDTIDNIVETNDPTPGSSLLSVRIKPNYANRIRTDMLIGSNQVKLNGLQWKKKFFFEQEYRTRMGVSPSVLDYLAFDAILTYGMAVKIAIQNNKDPLDGTVLSQALSTVDFIGASGRNKFASQDRFSFEYTVNNFLATSQQRPIFSYRIERGLKSLAPLVSSCNMSLPISVDKSNGENTQFYPILNPPKGRMGHCTAVHAPSDRTFIFGGRHASEYMNDMWSYSFKTEGWQKIVALSADVPTERWDFACSFVEDSLVVFGGVSKSILFNDLWTFDVNTNQWHEIIFPRQSFIPTPRTGIAFTTVGKSLYTFSGYNDKCDNNLYQLDMTTTEWSIVDVAPQPDGKIIKPPERYNYCISQWNNAILLYGGTRCNDATVSTLWMFNLTTSMWNKLDITNGKDVAGRLYPRCEVVNNLFIMSGGIYDTPLNDMYQLSLVNQPYTWKLMYSNIPSHSAKVGAQFAKFDTHLVWFAGYSKGSFTNELYTVDFGTNQVSTNVHADVRYVLSTRVILFCFLYFFC